MIECDLVEVFSARDDGDEIPPSADGQEPRLRVSSALPHLSEAVAGSAKRAPPPTASALVG